MLVSASDCWLSASYQFRAIHTYGGRATTAPNARPRDHLVIYSSDREPDLVEGESQIVRQKRGVRVTLDPKGEPLHPESRLCLSKPYTVEHDIPVAIVGKITPTDVDRIRDYSGITSSTDRATEVLDDFEEGDEGEGGYNL
jgi:hypothetical protein